VADLDKVERGGALDVTVMSTIFIKCDIKFLALTDFTIADFFL